MSPVRDVSPVPEAIRKAIDVSMPPEAAFRLWTERIDLWWPKEGHTMSGDGVAARMSFETRLGGRLLERSHDGRDVVWGEILQWDPPSRLIHSWFPGTDPGHAAQVEITFTDVGGLTRVSVEHTAGDMDPETFAKMCAGFDRGWRAATHAFGAHTAKTF